MLALRSPAFRGNTSRALTLLTRPYSTPKDASKKTENPTQSPEAARQQAAQLAMESIKDVGSLFSSGSSDEMQPIDTAPIFQDPTLFGPLSLLHQGQVIKELQDKYDKKWTKLTREDKLLGYYIAYGNWGVREDFANWKTLEPPLDLSFKLPSHIKTTNPTPKTIISKLKDPVILAETPVRVKQFDVRKMDPVTKFFIYLTVFIAVFAIARDKRVGEEGKPVEIIIEDKYENERQRRREQIEKEVKERIEAEDRAKLESGRKWYYLWLR